MLELNRIYNCDCLETMSQMSDGFIDLTVTSCPYDNLRTYNGYSFQFESIANELFRVTKTGGVLVWVVCDSTKNNNESLNSFKQSIYLQKIGFNIETMIYQKTPRVWNKNSYQYPNSFEYMFICFKGKPKTFNPIKDKINSSLGQARRTSKRFKDGKLQESKYHKTTAPYSIRGNVWYYATGNVHSTKDKIAFKHPAIFPEKLANDHIISWSNENDLVYDPFIGSGTTAKMARINNRNFIGSEISKMYCELAEKRLKANAK